MECACKHVSVLLKYDTKSRYMPPQRYIKSQPQEYHTEILYIPSNYNHVENNIYKKKKWEISMIYVCIYAYVGKLL